jgi:hypothetical protein
MIPPSMSTSAQLGVRRPPLQHRQSQGRRFRKLIAPDFPGSTPLPGASGLQAGDDDMGSDVDAGGTGIDDEGALVDDSRRGEFGPSLPCRHTGARRWAGLSRGTPVGERSAVQGGEAGRRTRVWRPIPQRRSIRREGIHRRRGVRNFCGGPTTAHTVVSAGSSRLSPCQLAQIALTQAEPLLQRPVGPVPSQHT